jgi:hypothetical protein
MAIVEPNRVAPLVADLGFLLRWDLPTDDRDALLVVALRARATERHFDPELVTYWRTNQRRRGRREEVTLDSLPPPISEYSWGPIEILDRFGISNTFFSVGGSLAAERTAPDTAILTFSSPGPIVARGGHSQGYDQLASELTAFHARLLVAIDFTPGAEARIAAASPAERYAAFLHHDLARIQRSALIRDAYQDDARLLRVEAARLSRRSPEAWDAAARLLADLDLGPEVRRPS